MLDVRCSQGFMGENSPKNSRIEPMNRRKTSNTQHPTSNNQWFPIGPLIGGWVLDVGCWMLDVRCSHGSWKASTMRESPIGPVKPPLTPPLSCPFSWRIGGGLVHGSGPAV